jgi:hypothetical protein
VSSGRVPILQIAPWADEGAASQSTVEWFRTLDPARWAASLITTEPSPNRRLAEIESHAVETWDLPDLLTGDGFPEFILGFLESRQVDVLHIVDARLGFDLLPDIACLPRPPVVVAQMRDPGPDHCSYVRYVTRRYGNLVDAFSVTGESLRQAAIEHQIAPSKIEVIADGEETGARHGALYERLLAARPESSRWRNEELRGEEAEFDTTGLTPPRQIRLPRSPAPEPTIGIIVPCFRHGIFLDECIDSIKAQTLRPSRIVVVDDGSEDPETIEAVGRLEQDPEVEVIRQPANRGPSAARNRALEVLDTSYVLPIDADDKLLPDALERMLARLEAAPEDVGFIYPHAQHFGNRNDFVRLPAYNLWLLMQENYCPAPALFDRRVFGPGGVSYPEEIVVGHEDWDLVLQLGARGVQGRHADGPTFLYRRQGFSRVNAADYGPQEFQHAIERRHPWLYGNCDEIKAAWAPALSLVLIDDPETWTAADLGGLAEQTCPDFEVLARSELAAGVRAVGAAGQGRGEWLQEALDAARGRWICVLARGASGALDNRSFVEHMLYGFMAKREQHLVALGRIAGSERHGLSRLGDEERQGSDPVGIAFERRAALHLRDVELGERETAVELVLHFQVDSLVEWRLAPGHERGETEPGFPERERRRVRLDFDRSLERSEFATRDLIAHAIPRLPELTPGTARRWEDTAGWTPPGTKHLCRHVSDDGKRRMIANHRYPPPGYTIEFDLGAVHNDASPGMRRLVYADESFELIDDQNMLDEDRDPLGYVEQEALPQMERLELRRLPETGQAVLVAGPEDPLFGLGEHIADFGWIEPFPLNPRPGLDETAPWGAVALRRRDEEGGMRHRYACGEGAGELLGSLFPGGDEELVELRLRGDGRLASELAQPGRASRDPRKLARWLAASPAAGSQGAGTRERLAFLAGNYRERRQAEDGGTVLGGLRRSGGPNLYPLFSTTHPATGDQFVTCEPKAALARGYLLDGVLGYIHIRVERSAELR